MRQTLNHDPAILLLISDYFTIRVDREVKDRPNLQKALLNEEVSNELAALIIPRPTAYILAWEVRLVDEKTEWTGR